jgi:hypothetical protein
VPFSLNEPEVMTGITIANEAEPLVGARSVSK